MRRDGGRWHSAEPKALRVTQIREASCSGFWVSAYWPKAATLLFKAGDIIHGYIAEEKLLQNALRPVIAK